jgi:hypothetical protein
MWPEIQKHASSFPNAVLSGRDADGYPASARTSVALNQERQTVLVQVPAEIAMQPGLASLLFHSHNEQLWDLKIHLLRGELVATTEGFEFRPTKLAPGQGTGLEVVRMIMNCRKAARTYLEKRGLGRPAVPWSHLKALKEQALKG